MRGDRWRWVSAAAMLAVGCAEGPDPAPAGSSVRDSAGVAVVTNRSPTWGDGDGWSVAGEPRLVVGELDGAPEVTFGNARDVGRLSDGRYFVADEQAHTVRVFDGDGTYLASMGREGQGPGELQWFLEVSAFRGDSLWVYDYNLRRVSVFGPDLEYGRAFLNPFPVTSNMWITAALDDGRFLAYSPGVQPPSVDPGVFSDSTHIVLLSTDGVPSDTVARVWMRDLTIGADGRAAPQYLVPGTGVFGTGTGVLVVDPAIFVARRYDGDGRLERVFGRPWDPVPVTDAVLADFREWYLRRLASNSEVLLDRLERRLRDAEYPAHLPASSSRAHVDALGYTWIGRYAFPLKVVTEWEVFDPDGVWLGTVTTPDGLEIKEVLDDEIVGIWTDDLGVAQMRVYALER